MADEIRMTTTVAAVLREFLDDPQEPHYGLEMMRKSGISSGSLYPILARLERARWIESELEDIDPSVERRRPRRYYTMTAQGEFAATQALNRLSERLRLPQWVSRPSTANVQRRAFDLPVWGAGKAFGGAQ